ncbi:MAG: right-handed parallel beta-helix repeat-containing protein [Patescibacteria group bacterium]
MNFWKKQIKIIVFLFLLSPTLVLANDACSKDGYTILTLNGIFTNEEEARDNKRELERKFGFNFNNQPLKIDFIHNPSHLAGLGDVLKAAYQGLLDDEIIQDYDLTEMLKTASQKITTQKVLIVAHSQGNFYANSFYDVVAGQEGGVPKESIGVYALATPSGRISGEGLWLTSTTDKVIAGLVGSTLRRNIMTPNITIDISKDGDSNGHGFSTTYLKHQAGRIVSDIEKSLNRLQDNTIQKPDGPCINPPKISLGHKITGAMFVVADPVANTGSATISGLYKTSNFVLNTGSDVVVFGLDTTVQLYGVSKNILETGGTLVYKGIEQTSHFVFNSGRLLASGLNSMFSSNQIESVAQTSSSDTEQKPDELKDKEVTKVVSKTTPSSTVEKLPQKDEEKEIEKEKVEEKPIPEIIQIVPIMPKSDAGGKVKTAPTNQNNANSGGITPAPIQKITINQCNESISISRCLISDTVVSISWEAETGALGYNISLNGAVSTTTSTSIALTLEDFSDYTFELSPILAGSTEPPTTTASFSVATIPVAINEIAFWGTSASDGDEWLELKNNTSHSIDMSHWGLKINNGNTIIPLVGTLAPNSYLLLMRGSNSVSVDNGASIFSWDEPVENIFNDYGEEIVLLYGEDRFDSTPFWKIEDSTDIYNQGNWESIERKKSMNLGSDFSNWGYNLSFIKNGTDSDGEEVNATPGEHNSLSYLINDGGTLIEEDLVLDSKNGPYAVFDTIIVSASSTLTIEEGSEIMFIKDDDPNFGNFLVLGKVVAGGAGEITTFESASESSGGFFWFNTNQATSTFENVLFKNTETIGLLNESKVKITNSSFLNNGSGINAYNGASLVLENVTIASTTGEAVAGYNSSIMVMDNIVIENAGNDGIAIYNSFAEISSTTIDGSENNGLALYFSTTTITDLNINNTGQSGLYVVGGVVDATGLTISDFESGYAVEAVSPVGRSVADVIVSNSKILGTSDDVYETIPGSIIVDNLEFCDTTLCLAN